MGPICSGCGADLPEGVDRHGDPRECIEYLGDRVHEMEDAVRFLLALKLVDVRFRGLDTLSQAFRYIHENGVNQTGSDLAKFLGLELA